MGITERAAYLKGLADGLELDKESKEGKILFAVLDVLEDMALELRGLRMEQENLSEKLDELSGDLEDVESILFGNEAGYGGGDDEEASYSVLCPECGNKIIFDEDALENGEIICPDCGETLEFNMIKNPGVKRRDGGDDEVLPF